ncbi:MAG: hypothetical protein U1E29_13010 [Coriobacteriia bacterium]|nr:hypothetical protein [Coriobacteriia bacterium]
MMHKDAVLALYRGGAPATDTIFCTLPVAAILCAIGVGAYLIRHARLPQSPESAAAVEKFFSEEES